MPDFGLLLQYSVSFLLIALAAKQIGKFFSQYGLPYITGYLLAGVLAGPFVLEFLPEGATNDLRYIDDISLAVIAFIAGSELYLKELRDRMRAILLNIAGIVVCGFILIGATIYALTFTIPFMDDFGTIERLAAALLGATILLALSPASTIAVIQEVRARGKFTQTVLSITVVMDVVIIVLFALVAAFADTLLDGVSPDPTFVLLLILDIGLAVLIGALIGRLLQYILSLNMRSSLRTVLILGIGAAIFAVSFWIDTQKFGIHLEPLLTTMIAGFYVTNATPFRHEFEEILHEVSPYIYVAFFALTGVALKLDILLASGVIAGGLFLARMLGIFVGSYTGGTLAGEDARFKRLSWAGLITQAGIALGLAREVSVEFPTTLGDEFATLLISVVVLNEIFGPILLKTALRRAGESREPGQKEKVDGVRHALILGIEGQTAALARQLKAADWDVVIADTDEQRVTHFEDTSIDVQHIPSIDYLSNNGLLHDGLDALVAMLDDDDANLHACEVASSEAGVSRLVVRPADLSRADEFTELGAKIVDPASAMVALLEQFTRVPHTAALLAHQEEDAYSIKQVTVTEKDADGKLVRDLRLPVDVLILEIDRHGNAIVPHGHTSVHIKDELTLVGKPESLKEVQRRLGY